MRLVIDGLPIRDDENLGRIVSRLLQVWTPPHATDELHLVVAADTQIVIPDWVVVHQLRSGRLGAVGRLYARGFGLRHLSRALRAQVVLGLRPATVLSSISCPRGTIGYSLWRQPGSEQFSGTSLVEPEAGIAWSGFANRLRLSMVDAIADRDWHARRFKIHPALLWSRPGGSSSFAPMARLAIPPRRSLRWVAAVSTSTLALSAAAAASVDLVASHSFPVATPHHVNLPFSSHPATAGGSGVSGDVPLPAPTTTSSTSTTAPTSALGTTVPSTSTPTTASGLTKTVTGLTVPGLTLPTVTLPKIPTPTLPLPIVSCTTGGTTTSSPLSILNLCNLHVSGLP